MIFTLSPLMIHFINHDYPSIYGPHRDKTCLPGVANSTGAAHLRRLISDFVIGLLESIISRLATSKISNF